MNGHIERTIRVVDIENADTRPARYWRARPLSERFAAMLALHHEGNVMFRGGHVPFVYVMKVRNVDGA